MNILIIVYIILCFFIFYVCATLSHKLNLLDYPNKRKIHKKPIAYTGGMAIVTIYLISLKLFEVDIYELNIIISVSFLISIVGFIDDKYSLNAGGKLCLQIIPIFYLIVQEKILLNQIGDYIYFDLNLGSFSIPFTLLSVLFLLNSFNYFDGIDGSLGFSSISVFGILFFLNTDHDINLFLIIIIIPIIIFLIFNFGLFNLKKLFLGDSGSLLLGFVSAFILIYLANKLIVHPILLAWSVSIFTYEFLSINFIRIKNKQDPFKAGKDHLHHILLEKSKSVLLTNFIISVSNIVLFIAGYCVYKFLNPLASLILFIILFIIFLILRNNYSIKK